MTDADGSHSKEIADLNLTYMLLAQKMLIKDRAAAMLRLGISAELADLLLGMSLAQTIKVATSNFVLCHWRLGDLPVARVINDAKVAGLQAAHLSIMLAGAPEQMPAAIPRVSSSRFGDLHAN